MKRNALAKAAFSSLVLGTTMVGCTGAAFRPSAIAPAKQNPDRIAAAVDKALADRDATRAVAAAEAAVQAAPQDASYRHLLGRAYVADGRFASAETALGDAMTLGNQDPRTIVSLALVKVALGKSEAARDLLSAHADVVPAGDYGLAIAMAGDAAEGVRILSEAIHDPSATARTRQNLAYAYALAGRWKDARVMAGIDLEPLAANQRIAQWAQTAAPEFAQQRIAGLMGVTINGSDAGQPVALALAPEPAPVQSAQAPEPIVEAVSMEVAAISSRQSETVPSEAFAPVETHDLAFVEGRAPLKLASVRQPAAVRVPLAPRRMQAAFIPQGKGNSNWVVQLGAYENAAIAKEKWFEMARRNHVLSTLPVLTSQITLNGVSYSRLAVSGFNDRLEAVAMCRAIRAQRGRCFVRENVPDAAPQRWAVALKQRQFASR
ncbi:Sporulation domain-containing protein precursor [Sphingobium herbicidovorans NBRC 16415]|uniref:Sporulation domain-containing protein n=1 Tax=Sphingobium herbicidovorans (strain ATCC 700291 / DSM 11019 / CCUG 56400 / KCTC 2939 / LMG 18315 / NBRC 16415 / MH) TaxID=1219045 RepID=A0A086PCY6_SPHHM|nr:SPOR domain-containing protein [Sphingobium herbicidovorans]KFG91254.1 Sporulation domain-containing protein precursor [Sphingobium herbicidovorans NBRC 16415]